MAASLLERIAENPFYVLGLPVTCTRQEVEREGQKLLSMLTLNLHEALTYSTPLGPKTRSPELVRMAMAELRDPAKRLGHELFAVLPASTAGAPVSTASPKKRAWAWPNAPYAFSLGPDRSDE